MVVRTIVRDEADAALSREAAETGVAPRVLRDLSLYLVGTGTELRDRIERWRGEGGITYVTLFDPGEEQIERIAEELVGPLGPS